jgi:exopolysaccharide biosynthesis polyprenyl glycosylphosphotransferase
MMDRRIDRLAILLFLGDILLTPIGLLLASQIRIAIPLGLPFGPGGGILPWPVYLLAAVCWSGALLVGGAYDLERLPRRWATLARLTAIAATATVLFAGVLYLTFREVSRLQFAYFFVLNLGLLALFRAVALGLWQGAQGRGMIERRRVLLVGAGELGQAVARALRAEPMRGYLALGFLDDEPLGPNAKVEGLPVLGTTDHLLEVVREHQADEMWSALPPKAYDRLHRMVAELERIPIRIKVIPDYFSLALVQARTEMLGGIPIIGLREPVIEGLPRVLKRTFDVVASTLLLFVGLPFLAGLAILIRLDSSGPILFRQRRVGENGRLFEMLKYRTMIPDAEARLEQEARDAGEAVVHKRRDDPRVTRVGRFLRRFSLDELPQLVNVLRGEMSLVGPRPEVPWLVERYRPWQRKRFAVPQGITGWWQINGRSDKPMHLNTDEDLFYVYNYSLWLDIRILLRTPWAVLQGRGAF